MTDEELIKRLRHGEGWPITAADRIEELVKEKKQNGEDYCALMEKHDALHVKLTKAVEYFKKLDRRGDALETFDPVVHEIVIAALAELEGETK